jgi:hypothetical protein
VAVGARSGNGAMGVGHLGLRSDTDTY